MIPETTQGANDAAATELSRPFAIARIGAGTRFVVEATPEECSALAARMGIPAIFSLTCRFDLKRLPADAVEATGLLCARVQQTCVVTLDAFDADIVDRFTVCFVPRGTEQDELDLESADEVTYQGGTLDLGEAASEQLALALDPFPRRPGAALPDEAQDDVSGAFAKLGTLVVRH